MTATTIPDVIVPSELLAYTGNDFMSVATVPLPNGNDSLLNSSAVGSDKQKAFQSRRTDSHLLLPGGENALSFWIRRRASFSPSVILTNTSTGATSVSLAGVLMGVGDPTSLNPNVSAGGFAWALWAQTATNLQFGMYGHPTGRLYCSASIPLGLNEWHQIVVNVAEIGPNPAPNTVTIYRDCNVVSEYAPAVSAGYYLRPSNIDNFDIARFALGDPTNNEISIQSAVVEPLYDIAKIAFHNRQLSPLEQLNMYESMYQGPAS